jgi:hypothetical protein
MSTATPPLARLRERARVRLRLTALTGPRLAAVLILLVVLSLVLRTTALHARYWIDEGLSVGIASHPFFDVPGVLRQDGSPPLYYLILHVWTALFGDGEARTHGLSVLFAVATVPVGFAFGRLLFDVRAGVATALLLAINPFLTYYAQETRMYALLALLSIVAAGSFALAFAERRRGWRWAFAASLALSLYTHNWALFFGVGTAVAFAVLWWRSDERPALLRDGLQAYGLAALAYLPWVPTLLFQARHTAAPWSDRPALADLWGTLASVLGGAAPAMAFALVALVGVVAVLRLAPGAGRAARSPEAGAILALLVVFVVGAFVAWLASQPSPAWATRYFAAILGPLMLLGGVGLSRAGWLGLLGLALLVAFWLDPRTSQLDHKSNAHAAAADVGRLLAPRDLVVAAHPEYGPTMHLYLPPGLRWASTLGFVRDPTVMDWRDALDRLRAAKPKATEDAMVRAVRPGQRLVFVRPVLRTAGWRAPWTKLVRRRAIQWQTRLDRDRRLLRIFAAPPLRGRRLPRGVRIILYERVPDGPVGEALRAGRPG